MKLHEDPETEIAVLFFVLTIIALAFAPLFG